MDNFFFTDRLLSRFRYMENCSLIVLEAPAGYGKTTVMYRMLDSVEETQSSVHWYTSVESLQDRSFNWFIRQIEDIDEESAEKLRALGFLNRSNADEAARIISGIRTDSPVTLVFDNFQFSLDNWQPQILSSLAALPPGGLRTVFISQYFGRLRDVLNAIEGNICFARAADFLLTENDIRKYALQLGTEISPSEIRTIHRMTEGWAAAVSMYIGHRGDVEIISDIRDINELIDRLFWQKLAPQQKDFLLSICLFDRFSEKDAALLAPDSVLSAEERDLLLRRAPLARYQESKREWYPHELLLSFLRDRLNECADDFRNTVCLRSGEAYERTGMIRDALLCYYRAKDFERILGLRLTAMITEHFDGRSYTDVAIEVLESTPEDIQAKYPLSLLRLCYAIYAGCRFDKFEKQMRRVRKLIESADDRQLLGEWYLVDAFSVFPDLKKMKAKYVKAETLLEHPSDIFTRDEPFMFGCASMWYLFYAEPGKMLETADVFEDVMNLYNSLTNDHGKGAVEMYRGECYSVQGRFEEADIQAYMAAFLAEQAGNVTITYGSALLLGINSIYRSDMTGLKKAIDYLENKAQGYEFLKGKLLNTYMAETVRGYLLGLMMETGRSVLWAQGEADSMSDLTFTNFMIKTCRITDLLLKKEYKRAIASVEISLQLDPRLISASTRNFMYCGLALSYLAIGRPIKASEYLDKSLEIAGKDKNYTFIACFRKYFQVLFLMPNISSKHSKVIQEIKALSINYTRANETRIFAMLDEVPELNELTEREKEVARLAAKGYRNSEIAKELHISENTVKHHLKIAFQKMNVDRRSKLIEMLR